MSQLQKIAGENKNSAIQHLFSFPENNFEKALKSLSLFCILFSLVLFIDFFLPREKSSEIIINRSFLSDGPNLLLKIETNQDHVSININDIFTSGFNVGDAIYLEKTMIFKTKTRISTILPEWNHVPYFSIYSTLLFIPLALIFLSLLSIFKKLNTDWIYSIAVLQMMILGGFVYIRLMY